MTTPFQMTTYRGTAVDPTTGRLFVAGDDRVRVFNADGTLLTTINNVYGAGTPYVDGTNLWVPETTAGAIARIDISSLAVAQTITVGIPVLSSVAIQNGLVWFTTLGGTFSSYTVLATVDPTTGAVVQRGGDYYAGFIRTIPGSTNRLLFGVTGLSPFSLYLLDTSGPTATAVDEIPFSAAGSNLQDVAVSGDGQRFVTASGAPYYFPEFLTSTMDPDGVEYPATNYPNGIAYTPANGGLFVGSLAANRQLYVWADGRPVIATTLSTADEIASASVQVSTDGSKVYAVVGTSPNLSLQTFGLAPAISGVSPNHSVQGVPTSVTVSGDNLGGMTSATVGNTPAATTRLSTTQVRIDIPTSVAVGNYTLSTSGTLGTATTPFSVVANTGATLSGTVRSGGNSVGGIQLTLSGNSVNRQTTSAGDGAYSFTAIPYGTNYQLLLHDPSSNHSDQQINGMTLVPNDTTTLDINLQAPPVQAGASLARLQLPPGPTRDVEFEPITGHVFVSVGDEVDMFSRDGVLLTRNRDQFGANGIALGGGFVWVNLSTAGRISRIDPSSGAVTGSWATTTPTSGGLAYASGKLQFSAGNDQWVGLANLDPSTGIVQKTGGQFYVPGLTNVLGANDRVLLEQGFSPTEIDQMDTSVSPPTKVNSTNTSGSDWIASANRDRVWSSSGQEVRLSTMAATGVQYPVIGASSDVAFSPAMGGLVATGRSVSFAGVPASAQLIDDTPSPRSLALDTSGDRAFYVTGDTFVVWSFKPILFGSATNPVTAPGPDVINGNGLGATTQVTVDGVPTTFTINDADHLAVDMPRLPAGSHIVQAVTPWGTSQALSVVTAPPRRPLRDFDGNGTTDDAVYRDSTGTWFPRGSQAVTWGISGDQPVAGDYNGDGRTDVAIYRPSGGLWYVMGGQTTQWGTTGDVPEPGDYNGDGVTDIAVYRPSTGTWFVSGTPALTWGIPGDIPVPGDYNGDGITDIAVFRPSTGTWFVRGGQTINWGISGDVPVPSDYNGNGTTDIAVYRPSTGTWFVAGGQTITWGIAGDVPVPGDYNGDRSSEIAMYRPSTGEWFVAGGQTTMWGQSGDTPIR